MKRTRKNETRNAKTDWIAIAEAAPAFILAASAIIALCVALVSFVLFNFIELITACLYASWCAWMLERGGVEKSA